MLKQLWIKYYERHVNIFQSQFLTSQKKKKKRVSRQKGTILPRLSTQESMSGLFVSFP